MGKVFVVLDNTPDDDIEVQVLKVFEDREAANSYLVSRINEEKSWLENKYKGVKVNIENFMNRIPVECSDAWNTDKNWRKTYNTVYALCYVDLPDDIPENLYTYGNKPEIGGIYSVSQMVEIETE